METPNIPVWKLKDALQEEIIRAHLYGTPQEALRLRVFARMFNIELNNEYIDNTIGYTIRSMSQEKFIEWLDERRKRDESISSK
jgi:hypothetical protein